MTKAEVRLLHLPDSSIHSLMTRFEATHNVEVKEFRQLFGGYSGCNFCVRMEDDNEYCLKVGVGYSFAEVKSTLELQSFLEAAGLKEEICFPLPLRADLRDAENRFVTSVASDNGEAFAFLMNYVPGSVGADKVEELGGDKVKVLERFGEILGRVHSVEGAEERGFRTFEEGGCCLLGAHLSGAMRKKIEGSAEVEGHRFVPVYKENINRLFSYESQLRCLPQGVVHGDPFFDNLLVSKRSLLPSALIDWEDVCVGPLLFDLGCAIVGSCFAGRRMEHSNAEALLRGYRSSRDLSREEEQALPDVMHAALLCNCAWRFVNFNIDNRGEEVKHCRESYRELEERMDWVVERREEIEKVIRKAKEEGNHL